ncbi:MAG: hypothetical protein O9292_17135 [Rhodobacteraceae bacterium]|jgi:hypothetical protein|nr:hypothetical protein [Paracoccaceae bacterium]MCZ8154106.1 hypothetical protein [Paracoccaceae bacterium]MCZ8335781.1 hypothetical protein [Paracoccaceae bacterium]
MSISDTTPARAIYAPRRATRRIEIDDEVISPRRLQQIENATVVMATALGSSVVFYAFFQYMS